MSLILIITLDLMNLIATLVHVLGCYLLCYLYRNGSQTSELVYLINLSLAESSANFLQFLANPISEIISMPQDVASKLLNGQSYIRVFRGYGLATMFYITMIYITLDRLLDIVLSIKYPLYWNEKKAKCLLIVTWVVSIMVAIAVTIVYRFTGIDFLKILDMYVYPIFDFIFLFIVFLTYGFIFYKYKNTRQPPHVAAHHQKRRWRESAFKVFKESRFYICVLLIGSFVLLMLIPDIVHLSVIVVMGYHNIVLEKCLMILWSLSYLSDGIIYIFMKPQVKALLWRKLQKLRIRRKENLVHAFVKDEINRRQNKVSALPTCSSKV